MKLTKVLVPALWSILGLDLTWFQSHRSWQLAALPMARAVPGCAVCLVSQSCPALCDPTDCSLLGSSVHGILQARSSRFLLQGIFPTQGSNPGLPHCTIWATREAHAVTLGYSPFPGHVFAHHMDAGPLLPCAFLSTSLQTPPTCKGSPCCHPLSPSLTTLSSSASVLPLHAVPLSWYKTQSDLCQQLCALPSSLRDWRPLDADIVFFTEPAYSRASEMFQKSC